MPTKSINAKAVAEKLGLAEATFRGKRRRLEDEFGFPPKLPGCNAWSEPAVDRWITTNGETYLPGTREEHVIADAANRLATEFGPKQGRKAA